MRYFLLSLFLMIFLGPVAVPVLAQGSGAFCIKIDEKENCVYPSMETCTAVTMTLGGYCTENFRLYGNKGAKPYCLATRFGTSCTYNSRQRCVNAAGARGEEGAACVKNYALSDLERRQLEEAGVSDCDPTDFTCQAGLSGQ
jgi:hypothetical protein